VSDHDKLRKALKWAHEQAACDSFADSPPEARERADMLRLIAKIAEAALPKEIEVETWGIFWPPNVYGGVCWGVRHTQKDAEDAAQHNDARCFVVKLTGKGCVPS